MSTHMAVWLRWPQYHFHWGRSSLTFMMIKQNLEFHVKWTAYFFLVLFLREEAKSVFADTIYKRQIFPSAFHVYQHQKRQRKRSEMELDSEGERSYYQRGGSQTFQTMSYHHIYTSIYKEKKIIKQYLPYYVYPNIFYLSL